MSLRMNFPLVLCNNGCSAFLSLLSGRKRRPTASAIFVLFTHLAAGCQQPQMNLCSSGTWTEFLPGEGTRRPTYSSARPPPLFSTITALLIQTLLLLLFPVSFCPQLLLVYTWAEGLGFVLGFFFQVPVLQLGFCFLARFN